jgi:hypothetical protein
VIPTISGGMPINRRMTYLPMNLTPRPPLLCLSAKERGSDID